MDTIGLSAIPLLSARPRSSNAGQQSWMVKLFFKTGNGASHFEALGSALRQRPHSIILYGFDLLHLDGKDLRQQTLVERRASLKAPLGTDERSRIQFNSSDFVQLTPKQGPAPAMLGAAATGLKRGE